MTLKLVMAAAVAGGTLSLAGGAATRARADTTIMHPNIAER